VKNMALIREEEISFGKGLNILTGETGAGKSMIIGSINLALGGKGDKSLIRSGAEYALVQLVFRLNDASAREKLRNLEIYPDEDGRILLERRITPQRSISRINGELIANKTLKEVAEIIIDIHGQHEHQSLLKKSHHFALLDEFCDEKLQKIRPQLAEAYKNCKDLKQELEQLRLQEQDHDKELAFAQFAYREISEAALREGEDEQLEQLSRRMNNSQRIVSALAIAHEAILGQGENASGMVERAYREINSVSAFDEALKDLSDQFATLEDILYSIGHAIHDCEKNMEFDPEEFAQLQNRLDLINQLKSKYAKKTGQLQEVLNRQHELKDEIAKLEDLEAYIARKEEAYRNEYAALLSLCEQASAIRKAQAVDLANAMRSALLDLNFEHVRFEIPVLSGEEFLSKNGYDEVEFMISLNPGEQPKPLSEVASGGELSRVMLALKTVLADKDKMETLIFDEIDAGISGKTAWKVSEKLAILGTAHQIICITHLPQIAAMADEHFLIEKESFAASTKTGIRALERGEMIGEIARLMGSDTVTQTALSSGEELKKMADEVKRKAK
ncbi:MAG: DNA repair protein RecN, partial [Lachnospiraceae bacterium]|nr:DNA repair protein RecN [Lachnospiraceae bacterium]